VRSRGQRGTQRQGAWGSEKRIKAKLAKKKMKKRVDKKEADAMAARRRRQKSKLEG
jgi:hypothetical protein